VPRRAFLRDDYTAATTTRRRNGLVATCCNCLILHVTPAQGCHWPHPACTPGFAMRVTRVPRRYRQITAALRGSRSMQAAGGLPSHRSPSQAATRVSPQTR
jgi:hypothetical protein